jgi:uncharacterized protein with NRDE domain
MCLLVAAWDAHAKYRLVIAANRDEYHARAAAPLGFWQPNNALLAGQDLQAGGTWFGLDRQQRVGIITNFREMTEPRRDAPSRGHLIVDYLRGAHSAADYLDRLESTRANYAGYSLMLADRDGLHSASNRALPYARKLTPGIYGLSNHLLDTPWPKVERLRQVMQRWLATSADDLCPLWQGLADRETANDLHDLPPLIAPGMDPSWQRRLSSPFVKHELYGTRCSSLLLLDRAGGCQFYERRFNAAGVLTGQSEFTLASGEWG